MFLIMAHFFRIIIILSFVTVFGTIIISRFFGDEGKKDIGDKTFKLEKDAFDFSAIPVIDESLQETTRGKSTQTVPENPLVKKEIQQPLATLQPPLKTNFLPSPPAPVTEKKVANDQRSISDTPKDVSPEEEKRETTSAPLPPLNTEAILAAVVKIQCLTDDSRGKYIGSGFSVAGGKIVTAAHVVKDSGEKVCDVIFPGKNRTPVHYLRGALEDIETIKKRHDGEGIDIAFLTLPDIAAYPEARAIFSSYPVIPYPVCKNPAMISMTDAKGASGDLLLHYGYPSNFVDQNYLAEQEGRAIVYADVTGIKDQYSDDFFQQYKTPEFSYTADESKLHPYMISRVASFYGDSGGLAFNTTKQCILGPHRGGTVGREAGENYSIFPLLGWWEKR